VTPRDPVTAAELHRGLIDQLAGKGLLDDSRRRAAFQAVRREHFLPGVDLDRCYRDEAVTIQVGPGGAVTSSSSQPSIMARMLAQLDPQPGDHVLEIGAGTGYDAALLAHLVGPGGQVTTIDIDRSITRTADANLARAGVAVHGTASNVEVCTGDGWLGVGGRAPFDRILVTAGVWDVAPAWTSQLAPGGTLVVPLWLRAGVHVAAAFTRLGEGRLLSTRVAGCDFVRLRGPHAGPAAVVEVREGLLACVDGFDAAHLDLLSDLLATEPRLESAPPLPRGMGWFARMALDETDAIQLFDPEQDSLRLGLFNPTTAGPGLALVVDGGRRLAGFGDHAPLARLRGHLTHRAPLDFHALSIEAIPVGIAAAQTVPDDTTWVLMRPAHHFWIRDR
jgi:protein-L-isoaspartate(D-aspartate) O-methyltransferase